MNWAGSSQAEFFGSATYATVSQLLSVPEIADRSAEFGSALVADGDSHSQSVLTSFELARRAVFGKPLGIQNISRALLVE